MKTLLPIVLLLVINSVAAFELEFQQQVDRQNWRMAERLLQTAENDCRQNNTDNCIDRINFSRAWMYRRRADQSDDGREALLQRARDSYLAVLNNNPRHIPTIDNLTLVLEDLSDRANLERVLSTLKTLNENQRAAKVAVMIADLYRADNNSQRAFSMYMQAYELQKSNRVFNGLIETFNQSPSQSGAQQLMEIAITDDDLSLRRAVCEAIINQRQSVGDTLWETAAINWIAWLGRERHLTTDLIQQSITLTSNPEFQALLDQLQDPLLGLRQSDLRIDEGTLFKMPRHEGWWNDNLTRAWAFSVAAWSVGHNHLLNGELNTANTTWMAALQFAPPSRAYDSDELEGRWAVSLELITDIARLQQLYKAQLDPEGEMFSRIENALFRSKAMAYEVNDLEAIQRHHTIMGKMYADIGIFSQARYRVASAEFQLENAIKTANLRAQKSGTEDPQPMLAKLLAEGYECKLPGQKGTTEKPINCTTNNQKAATYYTTAARDFIKLDAVAPARQSLDALKVYQPEPTQEVQKLRNVIDLRASLTQEQLQKGQNHPDVVLKQIDLAREWDALGEDQKAQESINRAVLQSNSTELKSEELYKTLKNKDSAEVKKITRESLQRTQKLSQ